MLQTDNHTSTPPLWPLIMILPRDSTHLNSVLTHSASHSAYAELVTSLHYTSAVYNTADSQSNDKTQQCYLRLGCSSSNGELSLLQLRNCHSQLVVVNRFLQPNLKRTQAKCYIHTAHVLSSRVYVMIQCPSGCQSHYYYYFF